MDKSKLFTEREMNKIKGYLQEIEYSLPKIQEAERKENEAWRLNNNSDITTWQSRYSHWMATHSNAINAIRRMVNEKSR